MIDYNTQILKAEARADAAAKFMKFVADKMQANPGNDVYLADFHKAVEAYNAAERKAQAWRDATAIDL